MQAHSMDVEKHMGEERTKRNPGELATNTLLQMAKRSEKNFLKKIFARFWVRG